MPFVDDEVFTSKVRVEQVDAVNWLTLAPHRYVGGEGDVFDVPAGYRTDFASSPRITSPLVPRYGLYTLPAILHDRLLTDYLDAGAITSNEADGLFRRALREAGVPVVKRWLMWAAVRWAALFNPVRRKGWLRSAPGVVAISIPALLLLPMIAGNVYGLIVYGVSELIATGGRHAGTLKT